MLVAIQSMKSSFKGYNNNFKLFFLLVKTEIVIFFRHNIIPSFFWNVT